MKIRSVLVCCILLCSTNMMAQQTINQTLTLNSNGINSTEILLKKEDNVSYNSISSNSSGFGIYNSTTNRQILYANSHDFVGIGTTNPLARLHVNGVVRAMHSVDGDNSGDFENTSPIGYGIYSKGGGGGPNLYPFRFDNYNGSTILASNGSGNVGVGTYDPLAKLDIRNGNILVKNLSNTTGESVPMIAQSLNFGNHTFGTSINSHTESGGSNSYALQFFTQETYLTGLTEKLRISANGNVGVGTPDPREKLSVNGKIRAHEVKVETANWPDYVFEDSYQPQTLTEIEKFIKENKHLPEVPSAKEVEQNGVELGEMNKILLKKIEELTLLLIEQNKKNEQQDKLLKELMKKVN